MKILVLEDEEIVARGLLRTLRYLGVQGVHAQTISSARELLSADSSGFDAIIADVGLSDGESGINFIIWARQHYREVRRIAISGASEYPPEVRRSPPHEMFLPKPIGRKELEELFASWSPVEKISS